MRNRRSKLYLMPPIPHRDILNERGEPIAIHIPRLIRRGKNDNGYSDRPRSHSSHSSH